MNAERWQQIESIFQSALALKGSERADYVDRVCAEDKALQHEVESLLAAYEKIGGFMSVPAHEVAARLIAEDLSRAPTLLLNTDVAGGGDKVHETNFGSAGRRRLILVGLFFTLMAVYIGVHGYFYVFSYRAGTPGWVVGQDDRVQIAHHGPDKPASALRDGDEVVALNGQPFKNRLQWWAFFDQMAPGSPYTVVIRSDGQTRELTLRTGPTPFWHSFIIILSVVVVPTIFFLTGVAVFLLRPDDKQALLLALMLGMFASGMLMHRPSLMLEGLPWWLLGAFVAAYAVMSVIPAVFLHFFLVFPECSPLLRRFPRFEYYIYLPQLLVTSFYLWRGWLWVNAPERFFDVSKEFSLISNVVNIEFLIYVIGGLMSLVINYRQASFVSRRKMRVVVAGSILGFLSAFAYYEVFAVLEIFMPTSLWLVISFTVSVAISLVPLSFAYAIVRHQVIPVSLIIRRSLQYLLAKNGLRVIIALPVVGLLLTIFADPNRTLREIFFQSSSYFYLLLIVAFAFGLMFRRRLGDWVDRQFFREVYNQEKILRELIADLKHLDSLREMSEHVSFEVEQALHPERLYLFHREEERRDLTLGHSSDVTTQGLRIPAEFQLLRFMETQGHAVEFPLPPKNNLPFVERAWLAKLGTNLIVPVSSTNGRLSGLFLLGEKKSEIPYTATDRQLLEAVANQVAVVYENVRLTKRLTREQRIKNEVLARIEKQDINLLRECPTCGACFDNSVEFCTRDQSELTLTLPVERVIEERYRLDQLIGKGGMGAVYEATDIRLQRKVAVKILSGSLFGQSDALRRFEREAQSAARLTHPHIITVYDYGVLATEGAYLVMELVRGETLGSILKREQRLAPAIAAEWLDQTLAAVGAAHCAGIIHRDLKPDNIFITHDEKRNQIVKVLDFGLAKVIQYDVAESNSPTAQMTTPGTVMGTFGYMSPEQLMGTTVDERSDIFSVGVIAVEALTGHRPFGGRSYHELLTSILQEPFHLGSSNAQEAVTLDRALQRCLAKDPEDRFTSAAETQQTLIPAIRRCPAIALNTQVSATRAVPS